jgi:hypothetical protein
MHLFLAAFFMSVPAQRRGVPLGVCGRRKTPTNGVPATRQRGWSDDRQRDRKTHRGEIEVRTFLVDSEGRPRSRRWPAGGPHARSWGQWRARREYPARLQFRGGGSAIPAPLRLRGGWCVSKSGAADLASVLADACPDARRVALDPVPEIGRCGPHDLVSLPRKEFVRLLATGR